MYRFANVLACSLALGVTLFAGCNGDADSPSDESASETSESGATKPTLLCTVPMLSDVAASIAGDEFTVDTMLAPGADPHIYTPTTADSVAAKRADVVMYVGLRFEGTLADNLGQLAKSRKHVVAVGETLPKDRLIDAGIHNEYDPHVWMDVDLWSKTIPAIAKELSAFKPEAKATFEANAKALNERLARFDAYVRETLATIPAEKRVMITAHDAFSYFGKAYDIRVQGVQGVSTESEAGIKDIQNLVELVRETGIETVFAEASTSDRSIKALVEAARDEGLPLVYASPLYSDSTGPIGDWTGTYIGMIDHNVSLMTEKLGGTVPEGGFRATESEPETSEVEEPAAA